MSVTFDGPNKLIIISQSVAEINVYNEIYSPWKEWVKEGDNSKYLQAMRSTGGDPITQTTSIGRYFFLLNGWKLEPPADYDTLGEINLIGNVYSDDGSNIFSTVTTPDAVLMRQTVSQLTQLEFTEVTASVSVTASLDPATQVTASVVLTPVQIASGQYVTASLAPGTQVTASIDPGSQFTASVVLTPVQIAPGQYVTASLAVGTQVTASIDPSSQFTASVVLTPVQIAQGQYVTASLLDGTIVSSSLLPGQYVTASIVEGTVVTASLADGTMVTASLLPGQLVTASVPYPVSLLPGQLVTASLAPGTAVSASLTPEQVTMLTELYKLMGLDPTKPLVVSPTERHVATDIEQTISKVGDTVTVTRS